MFKKPTRDDRRFARERVLPLFGVIGGLISILACFLYSPILGFAIIACIFGVLLFNGLWDAFAPISKE